MHVAVTKSCLPASAGVKSCLRSALLACWMPSVLPVQAASARTRHQTVFFPNQGIEGDNDALCLVPRLGRVWGKSTLRSHHTLAVRVQNEELAACKEVACIIIAARSRLHDRSDTYTKTGAALTPAAPEAGRSSRRHAAAPQHIIILHAAAPQHIIILYFIAICRAPKES